jgi:hypothetical protein
MMLARVVWRFDVELFDGQDGWMEGQRTFLSWAKPPLLVRLRERSR